MEFAIKGVNYRSGRLSAMQQFHVARRVAPALTGLVAALGGNAPSKDDFAQALAPLADAVARMPDADAEYVMGACLGVVSRQTDATTWAPVWRSGQIAFDDIDVGAMMQIAAKVIQDNLGNIFGALPASVPAK
ncbi:MULTISPECIES: phage tail assembly chaperone [unclassified Achromobacter]|uniref:phage tail assembly chaperone n=1 Tax=unclassified Achromobacter TaxID=2626865 RepID=UPI000B519A2F|nr:MULTISPECIES: hypothetical protein [unclassified Achromobacter]OWT69211.1 hypothetical protein CEY05_28710 [Achromobacter sp. HZ34]OWT70616.1 hypothetical protein CEY04_27540 [Achromobacter sp. HZ28]